MTRDTDRIPVPTNGRGPHPTAAPAGPATVPDDDEVATVAFSPTQLAVGFGIIASLILWLLRRRRGRGQ